MPFRVPKICDSCVHYHGRTDAFDTEERCDAFPSGIPEEIVWMGAAHLDRTEITYTADLGAEDELAAWIDFWYTADDDGGVAEGIAGIPAQVPQEPGEGSGS